MYCRQGRVYSYIKGRAIKYQSTFEVLLFCEKQKDAFNLSISEKITYFTICFIIQFLYGVSLYYFLSYFGFRDHKLVKQGC